MKRFLVSVFTVLMLAVAFAPSSLNSAFRIYNARNMNQYTFGNIDSITISVKPQGLYAEIGMYVCFSPEDGYFSPSDSLEVEFYFNLAKEAMIIDSWLWFESYIIKADHLDRWKASSIYENIVKRTRKDPSIVYKNSATSYELRIFPIQAGSYRKVKITYLVPMNFSNEQVSVELPFNWADQSYRKIPIKNIVVHENEEFKNARILELSNAMFTGKEDEFFGKHKAIQLEVDKKKNLTVAFDSPMKDGLYLTVNHITKTYQSVLDVSKIVTRKPKKIMVIATANQGENQISTFESAKTLIKGMLNNDLLEGDSVNIIFPSISNLPISSTWMPANSTEIEGLIDKVSETEIMLYGNFALTMISGVKWANEHSESCDFIVLSDNREFFESSYYQSSKYIEKANSLITEIAKINTDNNPFYVLDLNYSHISSAYINNTNYYNNTYFLMNLVKFFNGIVIYDLNESASLEVQFDKLMSELLNGRQIIDFDIDVENGLTYNDYFSMKNGSLYTQIGSFIGDSLFTFDAVLVRDGTVNRKKVDVNINTLPLVGYKNAQILAGLEIADLESQSNQTVQEIHSVVDLALGNRVLSRYTAFLALEFGDTLLTDVENDFDDNDSDDPILGVDDEEINENDLTISVGPNPFTTSTRIAFETDKKISEISEVYITDILGNKVISFAAQSLQNGKLTIEWNGTDSTGAIVAPGVYIAVVKVGDRYFSVKIVKI